MYALIDVASLTGKHLTSTQHWTDFGSPETFAQLPDIHKAQILFLDKKSTNAVYAAFNQRDLLCGDDGWGNTPFSGGCFQSVEEYCIKNKPNTELKKWLYHRAVAFAEPVLFLHPFSGIDTPAILTTWKLVVKYAQEIFSRDNLIIVSPNATWCLHYHHDGLIVFAKQPNINMTW